MAGTIRRRGKGSWQVRYDLGTDAVTGGRRRASFTVQGTRRDAERELTESLRMRDTGIEIVPEKISVAEFLDRWLRDYAKPNVAPSTFERYAGIVRRWCVPAFGLVPLTKLRPAHVQAAYAAWQVEGLSPKTVVHHHRMLREAFSHAVDWQLLAVNPISAAKPPRPERADVRFLEPVEIVLLFDAAGGYPEPYPTLVHVALATGARQGELLALRWQDTDLGDGLLRIVRTARRFAGLGIVYGEPKTYRSKRPVKLDADTVTLLKAHRAQQNADRLRAGPEWQDNDLVFCGEAGQPLDARNVLRWFQRIAADAGLGKLAFHCLRHTCGTLMASAGTNPKYIADRLGHANATFTLNTYVHTTGDAEAQAAEAIGKALRAAAG
jgi:integrase